MFVAKKERNKGDSPYITMDVPDAMPIKLGKFFVAANNDEKKLEMASESPSIGINIYLRAGLPQTNETETCYQNSKGE